MSKIITIGTFDGVHIGHRRLLKIVSERAQRDHLISCVISYSSHPAYTLFNPQSPMLLSSLDEKKAYILSQGIDELEILDFSTELASKSARDFLFDFLIPKHDPSVIVVGFDSHFGKNREGNYDYLKRACKDCSYELIYVDPVLYDGLPVSSSVIRAKLRAGEVATAALLLGRAYSIKGTVIHGKGLGKVLGFPTANLRPTEAKQLIPGSGIYLSKVSYKGTDFFGLTNLGTSPTVTQDGTFEIETFMLDFNEDIYGQEITLSLLQRLRDEKTFSGREELTQAMQKDLELARTLIANGL